MEVMLINSYHVSLHESQQQRHHRQNCHNVHLARKQTLHKSVHVLLLNYSKSQPSFECCDSNKSPSFFFFLAQAPRLQLQQQAVQVLPADRRGSPTPVLPIAFAQTRPALSWPSTSSQPSRHLCRTVAPSCRQHSKHPRTAEGPLFVAPATKS